MKRGKNFMYINSGLFANDQPKVQEAKELQNPANRLRLMDQD